MSVPFLGISLALLLASIAAPTNSHSDDPDAQFSSTVSVDGGSVSELEQFALELREIFDAPGDDDAGAVNAEPVGAVAGEFIDRVGMSVDLPMPCGRKSSGETCMETAERLCWQFAGGQMTGFLAADGELFALRCDDAI